MDFSVTGPRSSPIATSRVPLLDWCGASPHPPRPLASVAGRVPRRDAVARRDTAWQSRCSVRSRRGASGTASLTCDQMSSLVDRLDRRDYTAHFGPRADWGPVWSPDGTSWCFPRIAVTRTSNSIRRHSQTDTSGRTPAFRTTGAIPWRSPGRRTGPCWSTRRSIRRRTCDLWLLPMTGDGTPEPLLNSAFNEMQGQISPDGRWFAIHPRRFGRWRSTCDSFPVPADAGTSPPAAAATHGGAATAASSSTSPTIAG